jgi:hypothetical protein
MNVIGVRRIREFKGADVVLLAGDVAGLATFLAALTEAQRQGSSRLQRRGRVHDFVIEAGAANIELDDDRVVWRLGHSKADENREVAGFEQQRAPGASLCRRHVQSGAHSGAVVRRVHLAELAHRGERADFWQRV